MTNSDPQIPPQQERLSALRAELAKQDLDGFIVPRTDEFQGEYIPPSAERLAWLCGFTGSAGLAVILKDTAAIFIDGRYTLQVRTEVPESLYHYQHLSENPATGWVTENMQSGQKLGFDPWLMTPRQVENFTTAAEKAGASLVSIASNPIDAIWHDRPAAPEGAIVAHDIVYSGQNSASKSAEIAELLKSNNQDSAIISKPESIAWLLNVRGNDLEHSPLPLSLAIIHDDGQIEWFVSPAKISNSLTQHLEKSISILAPDQVGNTLDKMGKAQSKVRLHGDSTPYWVVDKLKTAGAKIQLGNDPCELPKAIKNASELAGTRAAHHRDGVAIARFLCWFDSVSSQPGLSEMEVGDKLAALRAEGDIFKSLSFDTISGSGPNGAIVHYRVDEQSNRVLDQNSLILVDSGGQYLDGTTDITRTIPIGTPSDEMRDNFTRVLQGHIALARAKFPFGTTGSQLDPFARQALWRAGLDYDHGTGHGVGSFLNVHEGPHRISKSPSTVPLQAGMIVSNEPGYYKTGAYGIRIENLIAVHEFEPASEGRKALLGFETLTKAPIDLRLVNASMMESFELEWLNNYHSGVFNQLKDDLDAQTVEWLKVATRRIS